MTCGCAALWRPCWTTSEIREHCSDSAYGLVVQRSKIQEESLYYETLKHTGEYPIIGVNTFLSSKGSPTIIPEEVIRATKTEKEYQISMLDALHERNTDHSDQHLAALQTKAVQNENLFEELMEATKFCSLGQITHTLFEVGGQYRRNM